MTREPPESGIRAALALDLRALAALRIVLGLTLLADLGLRANDLRAHYTDEGLLPRAEAIARFGSGSLHLLFGSAAGQGALFALAAIFALMLVLGLFTRVATVASYVLLLSLRHRNPLVADAGDLTAQVLLLWSIFLPLGARASLDALRRPKAELPDRISNLATVAWLLQILLTYGSAAARKLTDPAWYQGREVWFVVHLDARTHPLARLLVPHPALCMALTWGTLALELLGPLLLFVPRDVARIRTLVVMLFAAMHLGFALVIAQGILPLFSLAMWVPLIPSEEWESLAPVAGRLPSRLRSLLMPLVKRLPRAKELALEPRIPAQMLLAALLALTAAWGATQLTREPPAYAAVLQPPLHQLGLDQTWSVFEARPTDDGWWIARAQTASGREVDLFTGGPLRWQKPEQVSERYGPQREANLLFALSQHDDPALLQRLGRELCSRWNAAHPGERVANVALVFMLERTTLTGEAPPVPQHRAHVDCP